MATKNKAAEANDAVAEGFVSFDRNGIWFKSNAQFPLEDPTNAGTNKPLIRFNEGYTQATPTDWTRGQVRAGVLTMFDGHPEDEDTKALTAEQAAEVYAKIFPAREEKKDATDKKDKTVK